MAEIRDWDEDFGGEGRDVTCYVRVSTPRQAKEGFSVQFQIDVLRKELQQRAIKPRKVYWRIDAGKSGKTFENRKIIQIENDFRQGKVSELLVTDIDRIGRGAPEVIEFFSVVVKAGGKIWTPKCILGRDMISSILLAIFAWLAQMEFEKIRDRTMKGKAKSLDSKNWNLNYRPFGFTLAEGLDQ